MHVLFLDTTHPMLPELLKQAGYMVDQPGLKERQDYLKIIDRYDGVIIRSKLKIDKEFLEKATRLKFIGRVGAGMENIDVGAAEELGVKCFNSPEGNRDAVGEQAIGMLLALQNNLLRADAQVRNGQWVREGNRGTELMGKTIGIIGFGNTGSRLAKKLQGFDLEILAYDKYRTNYAPGYVKETLLEELQENADIISFHVPLTNETRGMFNSEFIAGCKKPFVLINTARGPVVKTDDLVEGMKKGKVTGACLDVLEYEATSFENLFSTQLPTAFEYLKNSDRVVFSPHIAGWTHESNEKLSSVLAKRIIAYFG